MDLNKFTALNVQIQNPASPSPSASITVAYLDPATDLEAAWADLKAEVLAHPQVLGMAVASEVVSGTIAPARGLTATVRFTPAPKPAAAKL